jgi:hypothetical protein
MNGLERYDSSFIYCSQATKEVLTPAISLRDLEADLKLVLRLQTKRDRLHFADGTIEKKICTYSNLNYKKDLLVNPLKNHRLTVETSAIEHANLDPCRRFKITGNFI